MLRYTGSQGHTRKLVLRAAKSNGGLCGNYWLSSLTYGYFESQPWRFFLPVSVPIAFIQAALSLPASLLDIQPQFSGKNPRFLSSRTNAIPDLGGWPTVARNPSNVRHCSHRSSPGMYSCERGFNTQFLIRSQVLYAAVLTKL